MSNSSMTLTLTDGTTTVQASTGGREGMIIVRDKLKGLWDSPALKTQLTERQTGDGAHTPGDILYSARTVTIPFALIPGPEETVEQWRIRLGRLLHQTVTLAIDDQDEHTYLTGHLTVEYSGTRSSLYDTGTITLTCPDPRRLSQQAQTVTLWPTRGLTGGITYQTGLAYPISYGQAATDQRNIGILSNHGNSAANPLIAIRNMADGAQINWIDTDNRTHTLTYAAWTGNSPAIIDCHDRTARTATTDETSHLSSRDFPTIPPGQTIRLELISPGAGYVTVSVHDTYM